MLTRTVWAAVFLLVAAAVLGIGLALTPTYQACRTRYDSTHNSDTGLYYQQLPGIVAPCEGAAMDANNGVLTAIATLFMTLFTGTLWFVTQRSVDLACDNLNATRRPTLEVRFVREVKDGIEITVINTGTGSAKFIAGRAEIRHISAGDVLPSPHELGSPGDFNLRSHLGPSASDTHVVKIGANPDQAFQEGFGAARHLFGWIVYEASSADPVRRITYFGRRVDVNQPELLYIEGSDWNFIQ